MFVTTKEIEYKVAPYGKIATIPAGIRCVPATNLPEGPYGPQYWVNSWEGMTEEQESWQRNYGFLVEKDEVREE